MNGQTQPVLGTGITNPKDGSPVANLNGTVTTGAYFQMPPRWFAGAATFCVDVYWTSFAGGYARVFDFGVGSADLNILLCNSLTTSTANFQLYSSGGIDTGSNLVIANFFVLNAWQSVCATVNATGGMSLYSNGTLAGTLASTFTTGIPVGQRKSNFIGKSNWAGNGCEFGGGGGGGDVTEDRWPFDPCARQTFLATWTISASTTML
jgi:hypothetical protein